MNWNELFFVVGGGLLGWWIVSWVISLFRQQKRPPVDIGNGAPRGPQDAWRGRPDDTARAKVGAAAQGPPALPAPLDLTRDDPPALNQWASILGVAESASAAEVEAAYHARLAECDRVRFAPTASDAEKEEAQARRARVTQAYEFVRPLKI